MESLGCIFVDFLQMISPCELIVDGNRLTEDTLPNGVLVTVIVATLGGVLEKEIIIFLVLLAFVDIIYCCKMFHTG